MDSTLPSAVGINAVDKLAVNGDALVLHPVGFAWQAWDGKLPLRGANLITSEGKSVILETDVMTAALQGVGKMYVAPPFATPGAIINLQLTVIPATLSLSVSVRGQAVVTAATMGTYTATVAPAMNPQGVPDPLLTKVGQWTVETTSQSSFRSGVPVPVQPEAGGAADGEATPASVTSKQHWVGVTLEDTDGNPLANQRVALETCNGTTVHRVLGDSGAARVDGITLDEERTDKTCIVRLVFDPKRVPVKREPVGFISVQVVNDDGEPLAGRGVKLTLADGNVLQRTLDELGRARFEGVPRGSKGHLEIAPALVPLEFTLVDEEGAPSANVPFTVKDSAGNEFTGALDDHGFASLIVAEGECDVSFDFDAAVAGAGSESDAEQGAGAGSDENLEAASSAEEGAAELREVHAIEFTSALFRLESAVVMPEGEAPDSAGHASLYMLSVFAVALRYASENPSKKLFIAGHADTSGDSDSNLELSAQRANVVLSVLTGDRETFTRLANASHTVADYKQILSWCTSAFPQFFDCDPGEIDDTEYTGIEPLRRFQEDYNAAKDALGASGPDLDVDGSIGPQTWGAFFDVYQFALREELGEDAAATKELQQGLQFVDAARKALGFGETQPSDGSKDNVRSQANRRVDVLFFEPGEEPDLAVVEQDPGSSDLYEEPPYRRLPIPMQSVRRELLVLRFLDEHGNPLQDTDYVLSADSATLSTGRTVRGVVTARVAPTTPSATLTLGELRFELRFGEMGI